MLTAKNVPKEDKTKQLLSDLAMAPALAFLVFGLYGLHFLFPWNAGVGPHTSSSLDTKLMFNQTHPQVWTQWHTQPVGEDNADNKEGKGIFQEYNPIVQVSKKADHVVVEERGDYSECDTYVCHMRFMTQEQARDGGIFYVAFGLVGAYTLAVQTHYAARAVSGLHLLFAVALGLKCFVFVHQVWINPDMHYTPFTFRSNRAAVVPTLYAVFFGVCMCLNAAAFAVGLVDAGKLTAAARGKDESGKSSYLVAGPFGSPEWKSMNGGEKGKQIASSVGLLIPVVIFFASVFYMPWYSIHGVTFRYTGVHALGLSFDQWLPPFRENATSAWGAQITHNSGYWATKVEKQQNCNICDGTDNYEIEVTRPQCQWKDARIIETDLKLKKPKSLPEGESMDNAAYGYSNFGSGDKYVAYEMQDCKRPDRKQLEKFGEQGNINDNTWHRTAHLVRLHARVAGCWQTATVVAGLFSLIRGAHYAARAASGINLGFGVAAVLWILQQLLWAFLPGFSYVPKTWRDAWYITFPLCVVIFAVMAGANFWATAEGLKKVKEAEGGAAKPAGDAEAGAAAGVKDTELTEAGAAAGDESAPPQAQANGGSQRKVYGKQDTPKEVAEPAPVAEEPAPVAEAEATK